ncbi:MAG: 2-succinyl-5-enolpyruvyl-6-hydroxy-3-cyclohexene-1-carboxylic-acid synthase [Phycisphaerales bacterium]|nr:2-succinyl-5-enolpyruvyl-6-hydroxy-3-cyclohexene-1-carboxylic-acid synthase [Phycisphaerales bacterium]
MDAPNINHHRAQLLLEELARHGVRHAILAPGSRSAPLAVSALGNKKLRVTVALDERAAGFCALGVARATGAPAVLIVTSGTAAANLLPAVVEASTRGTPMILLTADRPAELRHCGANQTIAQLGIFGKFARAAIDVPCPSPEVGARYVLAAAANAVEAATGVTPGPVQLNCMFREPLAPTISQWTEPSDVELTQWARLNRPWRSSGSRAVPSPGAIQAAVEEFRRTRRGVIVVGAVETAQERLWVRRVTEVLDWPVLADVGSGLRAPRASPRVVSYGGLALEASGIAGSAMRNADCVLRLGGPIASKRLDEYVRSAERVVHATLGPEVFDIEHGPGTVLAGGAYGALLALAAMEREPRSSALGQDWSLRDKVVTRAVNNWCDARGPVRSPRRESTSPAFSELGISRACARAMGARGTLMVGSSMPIRDLDMVMDSRGSRSVACNRGASGIDGLIATAVGHAIGSRKRVCVLLGDVSALHDLGSLALCGESPAPITVVVVNNDGGGIFTHLPIASHKGVFERAFATPHGRNFKGASSMFDLSYSACNDRAGLLRSLARSMKSKRHTLIEVQTDRSDSRRHRHSLLATVAAAITKSESRRK